MNNEPNIRQKEAFMSMLENGGKLQPAMEKVGYSKAYSKNPDKLKKTKGWQALMKEFLPDRLLVKVAKEGLSATQVKTSYTEPDQVVPDFAVRQRYLETALKMKGKLTEKTDITSGGKPLPILGGISDVPKD